MKSCRAYEFYDSSNNLFERMRQFSDNKTIENILIKVPLNVSLKRNFYIVSLHIVVHAFMQNKSM